MAAAHRFGGENLGRRRVSRPARRPYRARRQRCAGGRRIARDARLRHDADRANPGRRNRNAQWGRYPAAAAVGFAAGNSRRSCSRSGGARARDAVPARHRDRFCGLALRVVGRRSRRRFPRRASVGGYGRTAGHCDLRLRGDGARQLCAQRATRTRAAPALRTAFGARYRQAPGRRPGPPPPRRRSPSSHRPCSRTSKASPR